MPDFMTSRNTIISQQKQYWDDAAKDPDVAEKYIANVSLEECYAAISECFLVGSVLDIGCGIGRLSNRLGKNNHACHVKGIDISQSMLDLAEKNNPEQRVGYKLSDGWFIPFEDSYFRSAYSMLVFQHIDDVAFQRYITETYRVLEEKGVFRFQFVEGEADNYPVDHNHKLDNVKAWLMGVGFEVTKVEKGLVLPEWTWITAIKERKT